jgi:metal-sulfur cluster biosynthetic enzyme
VSVGTAVGREIEAGVRAALERVVDPCSIATGVPITLPEMGLVAGVDVTAATATVHLRVTSPFCMHIGNMQERIIEVVGEVPGIEEVEVLVDDGNEWLPSMMSERAQAQLRRVRPLEVARGGE